MLGHEKHPGIYGKIEAIGRYGKCIESFLDQELRVQDEVLRFIGCDVEIELIALSLSSLRDLYNVIQDIFARESNLLQGSKACRANWESFGRRKQLDLTFFDGEGTPFTSMPTVNVMLIGRRDKFAHNWLCATDQVGQDESKAGDYCTCGGHSGSQQTIADITSLVFFPFCLQVLSVPRHRVYRDLIVLTTEGRVSPRQLPRTSRAQRLS